MGQLSPEVSEVALGTVTLGHGVGRNGASVLVSKALDLGINLIDTADIYGEPFGDSEEYLGAALKGPRDQVVLITKTGFPSAWVDGGIVSLMGQGGLLAPRRIVEALDGSLSRLGTDYVDVYVLHWPDHATPLADTLGTIAQLIQAGKIRSFGLSWHTGDQVEQIVGLCRQLGIPGPVLVNDGYSLLDRSIEKDLLRVCLAHDIAVLPAFPLAGGLLTGKYRSSGPPADDSRVATNPRFRAWHTEGTLALVSELSAVAQSCGHTVGEAAISWLLGQPGVVSVVVGATATSQLEANVRAADWQMNAADAAALGALSAGATLPRLF